MVHKIKYIKLIILGLIFSVLCFFVFTLKKNVEVNLLKTLLPKNAINSEDIINIANKTSSVVKVVFEAENIDELNNLKINFENSIDKNYFEINKTEFSLLTENYLSHPENFISYKTRNLLKYKNYNEVYNMAVERLYNPSEIQLTTFDRDPYLLLNDFLISNRKIFHTQNYIDNKYYDYLSLRIKNNEGLSPDTINKEITKLVSIQKELSKNSEKIYLSGSPIHSYYTSQRAKSAINIICVLSIFLILLLNYYYFKSLKPLLPVSISIIFGIFSGFLAVNLWFDNFQIISMVFSTTLIGIGIDYSYHYFFKEKTDKTFVKNLTFSLLTTIIPFTLLYFSGIDLLKQVSVFTVSGLITIYLVVLFFYPCFEIPSPKRTININSNLLKIIFLIICIFSILGVFRFKFNDSISSLYTPSKKLLSAEELYNKISGEEFKNTKIITIESSDFERTLQKEEKITDELNKKNIEYISFTKFLPSLKRQNENFVLVKELYNNNLKNYSDILEVNQINNLRNLKFTPVLYNEAKYPFLSNFLTGNKSVIFLFNSKSFNIKESGVNIIDIKSDIEKYMKTYREKLLILLPVVLIILISLLSIIYRFKNGIKAVIPPISGIIFSIFITSLIFGEINLFEIITLFLILGFTIDYSIFRISGAKNCEDAILTSAITTSTSFLLLTLSGFKLLTSMALILFFGIVVSYITGYFVTKKKD